MRPDKKFIVITSIFEPSRAIQEFAAIKGWRLIVVGDKKTPEDWQCPGVTYLSPEQQEELGFKITEFLPWNHYCRKMVGYLYAISQGADLIADSDDDNIPLAKWGEIPETTTFKTLGDKDEPGFINIYKFYTDQKVWPRGLPLDEVSRQKSVLQRERSQNVGIWQFLAYGDPDVDAVYRLIDNTPVKFKGGEYFVLDENTFCPFNSQNTFFSKSAFPLLYLPAFVTFRFTDILRGILAQPILWANQMKLGFGPASVFQQRNEHDYMKDFESEVPMYLQVREAARIATSDARPGELIASLERIYQSLNQAGIVKTEELGLLRAWLSDLSQIKHLAKQKDAQKLSSDLAIWPEQLQ